MMNTKSKFEIASECAENWFFKISMIADLGERGSVESAYGQLQILHDEYKKHGNVLNDSSDKLRPLSDKPIEWPEDRGWSGAIERGKISCWSSAHEAAMGLVEMTLAMLFYPVVYDEGFDLTPKEKEPETRYWNTPVTDSDEQWKRAEKLLSLRWKAIVIPRKEIAELEERVRRERAKLLVSPEENISDLEWSVEKFKSDWRDLLDIKPTQWRRDVKDGNLIIEPIGQQKRCRISMKCLRRIIGKDAEQYT